MAKQRGIHQISGKINNLCYYEQKYVNGGLIRRINEAMSERLKTDPVFENTRHANIIFGGCSQFAKTLLSFFGNRNSFLFIPYRQAKLTEIVKRYFLARTYSYDYPVIDVGEFPPPMAASLFDSIFKNPLRKNFSSIPYFVNNLSLDTTYEFVFTKEELSNYCKKYNCKRVQISISRPHEIYASSYDVDLNAYLLPEANPGGRGVFGYWDDTDDAEDLTISVSTGSTDDAFTFWIVYVRPVLREYQSRPVLGETGAAVGLVHFIAEL